MHSEIYVRLHFTQRTRIGSFHYTFVQRCTRAGNTRAFRRKAELECCSRFFFPATRVLRV